MTKIHMTDKDICDALDMGGSVLTYDEAIANWGYDKGYGDCFTLDNLDTGSEFRFLAAYDENYFVCARCSWPFLINELADGDLMEHVCESCYEEEND